MLKSLFSKSKKTNKRVLVITFHTNYDTMNLNDHFNKAAIPGRLIPVPRCLSASCGTAWEGNPEDEQIIREQIARDHLEIDTITILE